MAYGDQNNKVTYMYIVMPNPVSNLHSIFHLKKKLNRKKENHFRGQFTRTIVTLYLAVFFRNPHCFNSSRKIIFLKNTGFCIDGSTYFNSVVQYFSGWVDYEIFHSVNKNLISKLKLIIMKKKEKLNSIITEIFPVFANHRETYAKRLSTCDR